MSTLVFVEMEIFTQADGAQSSRVPVPLPKDPYEAIRQAYLVGTDTKSEPFKDHPLTHTTPTLVPILCKSARMAVRVPPMMLPGLSTNMAEVAAMSDLAFCKRFRSSYESSPSSSPPDIPSRKRYRGMFELVEDDMDVEDDEDGDDKEEDEEMKEWDEGLAVGDEGLGMGVEGLSLSGDEAVPGVQQRESPVAETTVVTFGAIWRPILALESWVGQTDAQRAALWHAISDAQGENRELRLQLAEERRARLKLGEIVNSMRRGRANRKVRDREGLRGVLERVVVSEDDMDVEDDEEEDDKEEDEEMEESLDFDSVSEGAENEGPAVEDDPAARDEGLAAGDEGLGHTSRSIPESETPEIVSALRHPTHTTWMDPDDDIVNIDVHAYLPLAPPVRHHHHPRRSSSSDVRGLIRDHTVQLEELSPALFERNLKHKQKRVVVTFGAIWRPILALESWVGQTDAQRAALWHAISDAQEENRERANRKVRDREGSLGVLERVVGEIPLRGRDCDNRMSTLVFVEIEIFTQADGAQSSRVPVPLSKDPYEALMHAYLVGTDTKSEPFEGKTEAPKLPRTVVSPTALPDSTPPTCHIEESEGSDMFGSRSMSSDSTTPLSPDHPLTHTTPTFVPILRRSARMAVRVLPMLLPSLSTSMAEVGAMSDLAFCKRFRSSYESSPSSSPLDIPSRKRYQGTYELVEDDIDVEDDEEGDDKEEDEEMEESLDFDSVSEGTENKGPAVEDDPAAGDKGLAARDEGLGMGVEGVSLGRDEAVPGGQQRESLVAETTIGKTDAQRAALLHAISDAQGENQELRLQLAEKRRVRLELGEIVDSMRRGRANRKVKDREGSQGVLERVVVIQLET
nr:hypothetical protein [Tanacetum cinerariifolium]